MTADPMPNNEVIIRPYHDKDKSAIRQIAVETSFNAPDGSVIFSDAEVVADLLTRYFTDFEPESLWIAEANGTVIGYLSGCRFPQQYHHAMRWRIVPQALLRAGLRGALLRRETWRLAHAGLLMLFRGTHRRSVPKSEYPAHLHINIRSGFRGARIGKRLMEHFLEQVQQSGLHGVHASVHGDNLQGRKFFEALGFEPVADRIVFLPTKTGHLTSYKEVIYGEHI